MRPAAPPTARTAAPAAASTAAGAAGTDHVDAGEPAALLRASGLHVTSQRVAVLRAVAEHPHGTTDDVERAVRAGHGTVSRQAVYDALAAFTERGLVRRIQPAGSPARYERRVGDNHHHVVCRGCARMADVDCAVGYAPCLTAPDGMGYAIDEAEVVFWGWCPNCGGPPTRGPERGPEDTTDS